MERAEGVGNCKKEAKETRSVGFGTGTVMKVSERSESSIDLSTRYGSKGNVNKTISLYL